MECLEIGNQLDELERTGHWVREVGGRLGLAPIALADLDLCTQEAVTNVIVHGFKDHRDHRITLRMARVDSQVAFQIEDDGIPFDPVVATIPAPPEGLARAPVGGRGIQLIRNYMPHCQYHRRGGKNLFTLLTQTQPLASRP